MHGLPATAQGTRIEQSAEFLLCYEVFTDFKGRSQLRAVYKPSLLKYLVNFISGILPFGEPLGKVFIRGKEKHTTDPKQLTATLQLEQ